MAGILGVGSGIDIGSIVKALVDSEKAPKTLQLDRLEKATTSRFSALGTLKGSLSSLQTAVQGLNKTSIFETRTASSSNSSLLGVTATSDAAAGKYSIQVQQLATSSKVALKSIPSTGSPTFSSGTLAITAGSSSIEVDITASNNTLAGVRDAINTAGQGKGISATVVTDASGARLVLSSSKTGTGSDIVVKGTEDGITAGNVSLADQSFQPTASLKLPAFTAGDTFKGGNLQITAGKANINLSVPDDATLSDIASSINANPGAIAQGVTAAIATDVSGKEYLTLNYAKGTALELKATSSGSSGVNDLSALNPVEGMVAISAAPDSVSGAGGVISKAQSAIFYVDGLKVPSDSNSVSNAIGGVTLNLAGIQSAADLLAGKTIDVTVGVDKSAVKTNLKKFVEAYNGVVNTAGQLTAVVSVGEGKPPVAGALVGDATVRGLMSGLRSELTKLTGPDGARALAELGITTQKDGTLKIDEATLGTALDTKFDKVADYLAGSSGLMGRLESNVGAYLKTDGVFDQRTKALQGTLTNIDEQRAALDLRIEKVQARLVAQYSAMDQLVARLQKTSENLTNQLASLPGFVKKD